MGACEDAELVFENDVYVISVNVLPGEVLRVEAEQKGDGALWRGDFTSGYIEDITRKTGNCKKFSVFLKMLRSAILQDSDSVFVSLLTYYELEVLKARKTNAAQIPRDLTNNKRYLILTYVSEFDRVHYPLPLLYEDTSEPENLRRTIRRLKSEMTDLKSKLSERSEARKEEAFEQSQLNESNANHHHRHSDSNSMSEIDKTQLVKELLLWQEKYKALSSKYEDRRDCHKEMQIWRRKLEQLQEELRRERSNHKKSLANLMLEKVSLLEELRQTRDGETRTRVRLRESESELDHLKRRMRVPSARDLPPPRTRTRSSGATNSRRPSPSAKDAGHRSSSCPTFGSRCRDQCARHASYIDPAPRACVPRNGRRSPQSTTATTAPLRNNHQHHHHRHHASGSARSSPSERSLTPPSQRGLLRERSRDESPGKLLRDVKEKLAKYAMMEGYERESLLSGASSSREASDNEAAAAAAAALETSHHVGDGGCLYDIDARIEALHNYLRK